MRSLNIVIDHQCPQCGAPVELAESDRLLLCEYCRVKSYLLPQDIFHYAFPNNIPEHEDLIMVPYWRFKGMEFSCRTNGIKSRAVDFSRLALGLSEFPSSMGVRSQVLHFHYARPDEEGRFLAPNSDRKKILAISEGHVDKDTFHRGYIGETESLLYFPFYLEDYIFDGVTNKPVSPKLPYEYELFKVGAANDTEEIIPVHFVPTLCHHCGWDMSGDRDSLVLTCSNCKSVWLPLKDGWKRVEAVYFAGELQGELYLPFWQMEVEVAGIRLNSYEDLLDIANIPRRLQPTWEVDHFSFWSLAFKMRPKEFMRFNSHLTVMQPHYEEEEGLPEGEIQAVNICPKEALETCKISLANVLSDKDLLVDLPDIEFKLKSFRLVYMPFTMSRNELSQEMFNLHLQKSVFKLSHHLK